MEETFQSNTLDWSSLVLCNYLQHLYVFEIRLLDVGCRDEVYIEIFG